MFRQLLSHYLPLAVKDWSSVTQICEELGNKETLNSSVVEPTYYSLESEKQKGNEDVSQWSSQSCQEFEEMPNSSPSSSYPTRLSIPDNSKSKTRIDSEDVSPSSSGNEWTTVKRPKLDIDSHLSTSNTFISHPSSKTCTADKHQKTLVISSALVSRTNIKQPNIDKESECSYEEDVSHSRMLLAERHQKETLTSFTTQTSEGVPCSGINVDTRHPITQEMLTATGSDRSDVSSRENAENEWVGSGSMYSESTLDKLMDCLTQFKYSLQRLQSHQLLAGVMEELHSTTTSQSSCSVESIIALLEQLEELYEAMAN